MAKTDLEKHRTVGLLRAVKISGLLALPLLLLGAWLLYLVVRSGQFEPIDPLSPGACESVPGVIGAADITVDHRSGVAFLSSNDRTRAPGTGRGAIFLYDLRNDSLPRRLTDGFSGEFHPRGLSFYSGVEGQFLMVVNRPAARASVEIFEWRANRLDHVETVTGALLAAPTDVVAVGSRQFYSTTEVGVLARASEVLRETLPFSSTEVVYYDGRELRVVADDVIGGKWHQHQPQQDRRLRCLVDARAPAHVPTRPRDRRSRGHRRHRARARARLRRGRPPGHPLDRLTAQALEPASLSTRP